MNDRLSDAAETPKAHKIGIHVKLHRTTDAVELQPRELERLRVHEAHLRAALIRAGLILTPLGYIEGGCVQYAAQPTTDRVARPEDLEASIHRRLEYLIEEARAAQKKLVAVAQSAEHPSSANAAEIAAPEASGTTTVTGIAVGDNTASAADAREPAAAAPSRDDADAATLMRDVQHGPDIITVDGRPMRWSSAVIPVDAPDPGPSKTIECTLGQPEHHFVDRRGVRYRMPDSCDSDLLIEGTRVHMDHIRVDHVLATTITKQPDLDFGYNDHPD